MTSRLVQIQARFQQKQIQEREEKLLRMYENQQQTAYEKRVSVGRSSAGSNTSINGNGGGKVRQMFDERRQKAGVDRSYPLEPLRTIKSTTLNRGSGGGGGVGGGGRRSGSIDRNRTTIVKSTIKSKQQNDNEKITETQQSLKSIYSNHNNNNNNDDDDDLDVIKNNNHNLNGFSLDDEQMPKCFNDDDYDAIDDNGCKTKLVNVGGKLPSEKVEVIVGKKNRSDFGKTFRKDITTKPILRKAATSTTVRPIASGSINQQTSSKSIKEIIPKTNVMKSPSKATPSSTTNNLSECKYCNRRFATDRLKIHEDICMRSSKKKRKVYDATKHRVEGTELEQFVVVKKKGPRTNNNRVKPQPVITSVTTSPPPPQKKDWRRTHEEFINTIRAAKQAQLHLAKGGKLSDLPPPPPSTNPDYIQCPHCGRKFNQTAAERHIPKCATFQFNKPKPTAGVSKAKGKK